MCFCVERFILWKKEAGCLSSTISPHQGQFSFNKSIHWFISISNTLLLDNDDVVGWVLQLNFTFFSSTILEEEKLQQKERNRMEMRRQVTVSWDSGGSDEAPPKVSPLYTSHTYCTGCVCMFLLYTTESRLKPVLFFFFYPLTDPYICNSLHLKMIL